MKISIGLKSLYSIFAYKSGYAARKINIRARNNFLVLMYHRVLPAGLVSNDIEDGMYVTTETFEEHLRYLNANFMVLPLSKLEGSSLAEIKKRSKTPICFITFDDGWFDFYEYAYPLLQKYNLPATVFLTTGYIGTNNWFWTDRLASLLNQARNLQDRTKFEGNGKSSEIIRQIDDLVDQPKGMLDSAINILKKCTLTEIEDILAKLSIHWKLKPDLNGRSFMRWKEVDEMAASGLIEFGSHTNNHNILVTLSEEDAYEDINKSRKLLLEKSLVDKDFQTICYPNGSFNQSIIQSVKKLGFDLGFTTKHDWESFDYNPFEIHRIAVHNDVTFNTPLFACRIAGLL